ncbi:unnamed protein product [Thelazia callipaeda]|uniref:PlsC domain-containing protein n=1 Tax=Thelazia callipaeda TaxID=103827 RepID=A0A158RBB0_THECL|nr:unnamed protein product [Thelazia callipaeda]
MSQESRNGMINWLEIVEDVGGEMTWITQPKNFPARKGKQQKTKNSKEIIEIILAKESVQKVLKEECVNRCISSHLLFDHSREILGSMTHQMQLSVLKSVGYVVAKTIKTIYDGVHFNDEQLSRIREYAMDDPIIFIPTHRSYMDFLIVSLLCFHRNIPLPVIATGMDFMSSKFLGEILRRCGSFFMKRRFGKDKLYWSLFSAYVQTQLLETDNSIEFFLEGARSRSGKSLYPKFGLLQTCIEPFLRFQLYDIIFVPVTIDYDKVLEESLYAYELFGFPKPKETTTGLFKAREILCKRFGHIYVKFGEPLSIRKYFEGKITRCLAPWQVQNDNGLSFKEKEVVKNFAFHIIRMHNSNSTITIWPYTCFILLQMKNEQYLSLTFDRLRICLEDLITLVIKMGRQVLIKESITDDLRTYLKLHCALFETCGIPHSSFIKLRKFKCVGSDESNSLKKNYIEDMLCETILSHYANKMMHNIVDVSLLCLVLLSNQMLPSVEYMFKQLRLLFVYEFVCVPQEEYIDNFFKESLSSLLHISTISLNDNHILLNEEHTLKQIASFLQPFIAKYYRVMQALAHLTGFPFTDRILFEESLNLAINFHVRQQSNHSFQSVCITMDIVRNAIAGSCGLEITRRINETQFDVVNVHRLQNIMELLESTTMVKLSFCDHLLVSKI